ncbi:hypothetical protein FFWV33_04635 [Flavobacterium faecale]|uniref:Beta-carotene 15,15'-monooxygenase n=1 Tax=Flavobacterium faecale TaxID=1355330 RepID=A0A2S1LAU7_9FLAO|nr:DUF6427 family protein [Flavobacterium faecale]AWG20880.1 hypothetical protein FFWV33_04635 [Flavobacterium faecale]
MITSVFRKSTPLNFTLIVILILVFFSIYQIRDVSWVNSTPLIIKKVGILAVVIGSVFMTNFICKKNDLSKDSSYPVLFYLLFFLFFPSLWDNFNLVLANLFVLLALRRLISLHSLKASKEKIFDASLWIFVAALFQFWCILYLALVFISIMFHVARDYRNWLLPFIAMFASIILFFVFAILSDLDVAAYIDKSVATSFSIDYFTNNYQNAALSIYATVAMFFVISVVTTFSSKPSSTHATYKKVIASFFIAVVIFVIAPNKSNDLLIFTMAPLTMMATNHIEIPQLKIKQELVLGVFIACSLFAFFSQL